MKRIICVSLMVLAISLRASAAPTNLIVNGGFELSPDPAPGAVWAGIPSGATTVTGWTINGPETQAVDIVTDTMWVAHEGHKTLDLNGSGPGSISQTIPTEIGQWYELSFAMSGNPGQVGTKEMNVTAGPLTGVPFSFTKPNRGMDMMWDTHALLFQADSATSEISFESVTPAEFAGKGPAVDDVRVSQVPVPGDILLTGVGAVVLGWMRGRRFV
jgi:choice-of-anchor C domain-containing protein